MECPAGIKCKGEKRRGTVYYAFIKVPPPSYALSHLRQVVAVMAPYSSSFFKDEERQRISSII